QVEARAGGMDDTDVMVEGADTQRLTVCDEDPPRGAGHREALAVATEVGRDPTPQDAGACPLDGVIETGKDRGRIVQAHARLKVTPKAAEGVPLLEAGHGPQKVVVGLPGERLRLDAETLHSDEVDIYKPLDLIDEQPCTLAGAAGSEGVLLDEGTT